MSAMAAVRRVLDIVSVQVWCHCVLYLMPVIHTTGAIAVTTPAAAQTNNQDSSNQNNDDEGDIIKGLAAGFGFFFGLIMLVCLVWCFCCSNVCSKKEGPPEKRLRSKVSPSPPHSANIRTRPSATSSA